MLCCVRLYRRGDGCQGEELGGMRNWILDNNLNINKYNKYIGEYKQINKGSKNEDLCWKMIFVVEMEGKAVVGVGKKAMEGVFLSGRETREKRGTTRRTERMGKTISFRQFLVAFVFSFAWGKQRVLVYVKRLGLGMVRRWVGSFGVRMTFLASL